MGPLVATLLRGCARPRCSQQGFRPQTREAVDGSSRWKQSMKAERSIVRSRRTVHSDSDRRSPLPYQDEPILGVRWVLGGIIPPPPNPLAKVEIFPSKQSGRVCLEDDRYRPFYRSPPPIARSQWGVRSASSGDVARSGFDSIQLLSSAIRAHRAALTDTTGLAGNNLCLVRDAETLLCGDGDGHCSIDEEEGDAPGATKRGSTPSDSGGDTVVVMTNAEERVERPEVVGGELRRLVPFYYREDKTIEQLPDLPLECARSANEWADIFPTCSTLASVSALLRAHKAFGVTFMIPRDDQRLWSPPVGYHCVYESFFGADARLWFPIPRLITSYCSRRGIAISQLKTGAVRIAVALMVMAAKIDVSMIVRVFEEMTQTQPNPNGLYALQMRSGLHILTGHPNKTRDWQRCYFYVKADKASFEEPSREDYRFLWSPRIVVHPNTIGYPESFREDVPKIAALSQNQISAKRGFFVNEGGSPKRKRLRLPTMGKLPRKYPNYSDILSSRFGNETFSLMSSEPVTKEGGSELPGGESAAASDRLGSVSAERGTGATDPEIREKKRKRKSSKKRLARTPRSSFPWGDLPDGTNEGEDHSSGEGSGLPEADGVDALQDLPAEVAEDAEPPQDPVREDREWKQGSRRGRSDAVDEDRERAAKRPDPPSRKPPLATSAAVDFWYGGEIPLVNDADACAELIPQLRGGVIVMSETLELALADKFQESARADVVVSFHILRSRVLEPRWLCARRRPRRGSLRRRRGVVAERNQYFRESKQAARRASSLEEDLEAARATIQRLEQEKAEEADRSKKEVDRLRRSRYLKVMCERNRVTAGMTIQCNRRFEKFHKYMSDRDKQELKLFLHSQALGTLQSMDLLEKWCMKVPQKLRDILTEDKAMYRREYEDMEAEEITEQDLSLSPLLVLESGILGQRSSKFPRRKTKPRTLYLYAHVSHLRAFRCLNSCINPIAYFRCVATLRHKENRSTLSSLFFQIKRSPLNRPGRPQEGCREFSVFDSSELKCRAKVHFSAPPPRLDKKDGWSILAGQPRVSGCLRTGVGIEPIVVRGGRTALLFVPRLAEQK
ncbi:hypothetical protein N665_0142s0013 [Sinapis alba]|nr:hypothetical protein N665_0142s0013 [Sinapis alba]